MQKKNDDWSKAAHYSAELVNNFNLINRSTDYTAMYNPRYALEYLGVINYHY